MCDKSPFRQAGDYNYLQAKDRLGNTFGNIAIGGLDPMPPRDEWEPSTGNWNYISDIVNTARKALQQQAQRDSPRAGELLLLADVLLCVSNLVAPACVGREGSLLHTQFFMESYESEVKKREFRESSEKEALTSKFDLTQVALCYKFGQYTGCTTPESECKCHALCAWKEHQRLVKIHGR
jgi:hypothetical protein